MLFFLSGHYKFNDLKVKMGEVRLSYSMAERDISASDPK